MNAAETAIFPLRKLPLMLALAAVLGGCGQMGPLYLPSEVPEGQAPAGETAVPAEPADADKHNH